LAGNGLKDAAALKDEKDFIHFYSFDGILALNEHCFSIAGFIFIKCSCNDGMLIVAFT
jgi:hypothetical protein